MGEHVQSQATIVPRMIMAVRTILSVKAVSADIPAASKLAVFQPYPHLKGRKGGNVQDDGELGDTLACPDLNQPNTEHLRGLVSISPV
jgi:hypothetical protein